MTIHPFEETVSGLTGLPPFHNYGGDYWLGMSSAEELLNSGSNVEIKYEEIFEICLWLGDNITGHWCVVGSDAYFENLEEAMMFKLKFV